MKNKIVLDKNENMVTPSIDTLTSGGQFNRYALCMATAKVAAIVTDEYIAQRKEAERSKAAKDTDKKISELVDLDLSCKTPVRNAVNRMAEGKYTYEFPDANN